MAGGTLRADPAGGYVDVLDQTVLPHAVRWVRVHSLDDAAQAIRTMLVRGAPLVGATAAYGVALATAVGASDDDIEAAVATLRATRPTAVNLEWALHRMRARLLATPERGRAAAAWAEAAVVAEEDVAANLAIGRHGLGLLRRLEPPRGRPVAVMTHCNAGWLATVDRGTALAPVYAAHDEGLPVHVWVSETRPRNQGLLTAWELARHQVPHTVVADNAAGWLLMAGQVDAVIVGADRVAANGDVANKVGTYLKALACRAHGVPFYVAAPRSTVDPGCPSGAQIPIEERDGDELRLVRGVDEAGRPMTVRVLDEAEPVHNPAFDVTPAALVSAVISEAGVFPATAEGMSALLAAARGGGR